MCGIVGAVADRDVVPLLIEGLKRLEYRGYDSAGVAVLDDDNRINRVRTPGKIKVLDEALKKTQLSGFSGIAHTRWATHGKPTQSNAHPHICNLTVAVVHNGIIENHEAMRKQQREQGYEFTSETDTEVIVHQIFNHMEQGKSMVDAVRTTVHELEGAYALGVVSNKETGHLVAARRGSPLVIGIGVEEHFIASDVTALISVTQKFIFLEDGDIAEITKDDVTIYNTNGDKVERPVIISELSTNAVDRGEYRHYMLKEIFEQPRAIAETLEGRIENDRVIEAAFGDNVGAIFDTVKSIHIIACGTSFHAGLVARYWFESIAGIPCNVEVASEFRYRRPVVGKDALVVTISQSGETADTLAALQEAKKRGFGHSLTVCNVPESSLIRASDLCLMTRAGPEIGVASTKAFTTQLVALMLLVIVLGRRHRLTDEIEQDIVEQLVSLPGKISHTLGLNDKIKQLSQQFADKQHALFLGRGTQYPVAMEGALKLKEISYIHAEAYPAGELKHGPLALVDADMPVIAVAPNNELLGKLKSNLKEVSARGGQLIVFADASIGVESEQDMQVMHITPADDCISPIIYTVPLQLLAYHVAVLKGTDIDQPRNLAKSVTVE